MVQTLNEFFTSRDWAQLQAATGWKVSRDPDDVERVFLVLPARDGEVYRVLCLCDGYPQTPPSVSFVDEKDSKTTRSAWPRGNAEFDREVKPPPNCFLCMPLTREGLAHHQEWKTNPAADAWNPTRHSLMDIFNRVHRILNGTDYLGRLAPT